MIAAMGKATGYTIVARGQNVVVAVDQNTAYESPSTRGT